MYAVIMYITTYMTKPNKVASQLNKRMKQLLSTDPQINGLRKLRRLGDASLRGHEIGIQECASSKMTHSYYPFSCLYKYQSPRKTELSFEING